MFYVEILSYLLRKPLHTVSGKRPPKHIKITSSNTIRFSKFFHCYNLMEICYKAVIKYPTTPHMRRYTTL